MGKTRVEIEETLYNFGLPGFRDAHDQLLYDLECEVSPHTRSYKKDPTAESSLKRLRDLNIYGLVHQDAKSGTAECVRLLSAPSVRQEVFMSLLGRMPAKELVDYLMKKHGVEVSTKTVDAFCHYYFNVDSMSAEDWALTFEAMPPEAGPENFHACYVGGPAVAAYRLGLDRHVTIRDAVGEAVTAIHASLLEVRGWATTKDKMSVLTSAVSSLSRAHQIINTADQELAAVANELKQFKLARNTDKPISLEALTRGNHSNSGVH